MAEHPKYGGSTPGNWDDMIQYAQTQGRATEEMSRKTEELRQVEERVEQGEQRSSRVRTGLAGATEELTRALAANVAGLRAEATALEAGIALMERSLALRRQLASTPVLSASERVSAAPATAATTASGAAERTPAGVVPVVDPQAAQRVRDAETALAQAQIERDRMRQEVRSMQASAARPTGPTVTERATYAAEQTGVRIDPNRLRMLEQIGVSQQYRPTAARVTQARALEEAGLIERVPAPRRQTPAPAPTPQPRQQQPAVAPPAAVAPPQRETPRQQAPRLPEPTPPVAPPVPRQEAPRQPVPVQPPPVAPAPRQPAAPPPAARETPAPVVAPPAPQREAPREAPRPPEPVPQPPPAAPAPRQEVPPPPVAPPPVVETRAEAPREVSVPAPQPPPAPRPEVPVAAPSTQAAEGVTAAESEYALTLREQATLLRRQTSVRLSEPELRTLRGTDEIEPRGARRRTFQRLEEQRLVERVPATGGEPTAFVHGGAYQRYQPTQRATQLLARLDAAVAEETAARRETALAERRSALSLEQQAANVLTTTRRTVSPDDLALLSSAHGWERQNEAPYRVPSPERYQRGRENLERAGLIEPVPGAAPNRVRVTEEGRNVLQATVPPRLATEEAERQAQLAAAVARQAEPGIERVAAAAAAPPEPERVSTAEREAAPRRLEPLRPGDEVRLQPDSGFLPLPPRSTLAELRELEGVGPQGRVGEDWYRLENLTRPGEERMSAAERSRTGVPPRTQREIDEERERAQASVAEAQLPPAPERPPAPSVREAPTAPPEPEPIPAAGAPPREPPEPPERPPASPVREPVREPEPLPAQPPREPPRQPPRPVAQPPEEPEERPAYRLTPAGQQALGAARGVPEVTAEVLAARQRELEAANENVAAAQAELQAARNTAELSSQAERLEAQHVENMRAVNAADEAERRAISERIAQAGATVGQRAPLMLGPGPAEPVSGPSSPIQTPLTRTFEVPLGGRPRVPAPVPPPPPVRPDEERVPVGGGEMRSLGALRQEAAANAEVVSGLGGAQMRANQAFQEASAIYADNSSRLTRHGALTTEFISSLARGQVTLREFGEQMTATIGKFGGWAIAGAAVYGVFELFKQLTRGATESQAAIQNLGRFIPGLGGPAGGGNRQVGAAYADVRNLSTEFNVPISEVANPMQIMARIFPNLRDASDATRAVLAASRLDQVPVEQSTQYLTGISQSLGFTHGSQLINQVINPLNALQSQTGARVAETLPAIARAAPAAEAANVSLPQLEALTAMGVRAGIPGAQVGTAVLRSFGTFAWRPQGQQTLAQYGVTAPYGDTGTLLTNLFSMIDERARRTTGTSGPGGTGPLTGVDLRNLAQALGGPLLGTRTILPILAAEQNRPGAFGRDIQTALRPRPYQQDLGAVLGSVGERFRAIGISLENFGNQLASAGLLTPITGLLDAFTLLTHTVEQLASPLTEVLSVFNRLPAVVRDALGVFVAFRAGSALMQSRFGTGAQMYLGRLPGLSALRGGETDARFAVQGIQGNLERELLPVDRRAAESASMRMRQVQQRYRDAVTEQNRFEATQRPADLEQLQVDDPRAIAYNRGTRQRAQYRESFEGPSGAVAQADRNLSDALEQVNRTQAQIAFAKNNQYTWAERARVLESEGFFATSETLNAQRDLANVYAERVASLRRGMEIPGAQTMGAAAPMAGGAGRAAEATPVAAPPPPPSPTGAALGEAAVVAGATGAVGAVASELSREPGPLTDLRQGIRATEPPPVIPIPPRPREEPPPPPPETPMSQRVAGATGTGPMPPPIGATPMSERVRAAMGGPEAEAAGRNVLTWSTLFGMGRTQGGSLVDQARSAAGDAYSRAQQATWREGGVLPYMRAQAGNLGGALTGNPMAAFGGLMATQLVGGAIGGGVGNYVQSVGGDAMSGLIAAQMLRPGSATATTAGLGAGLLLGGRQAGGIIGRASSGVGAGLMARAGLSAATSLLPIDAIAPQIGLPLTAAAAIAGFVFGSGGGEQSGPDAQNQANARAAGGAAAARRMAQQAGGLTDRGESFAENLVTAYMGTGSASQNSQAQITAQMNRLTAQVQMFGAQSPQGQAANQSLGDILSAAYTLAPQMPAASQQIIQQVTQARQPVIQDEFAYRLSQQAGPVRGDLATVQATTALARMGPESTNQGLQEIVSGGPLADLIAGRLPTAAMAIQRVPLVGSPAERAANEYQQEMVGQPYQQFLDQRDQYRAAQQRLAEAQRSGDQRRVSAAQRDVSTDQPQYQAAQRTYQLAQERATPVEQGYYSQQFQQGQQYLQAQGTLAVAQAGGDPLAQLRAQVANQRQIVAFDTSYQGRLAPAEYHQQLTQGQAQLAQSQTQLTQQGLAPIAAAGQLAAAQTPIGDPVAQATAQWRSYRDQLRYMQAHAHAFDPSQIVVMQAQAADALRSIGTTAESFNMQMTGLATQISQAQDTGNAVAQANDAAAGAARAASQAVTPSGRRSAQLGEVQAAVQQHQAAMQRVQESAQLQSAQEWGDPQAQANTLMRAAQNELRNAHGIDEQIAAETAFAQAQQQGHQATMSLIQAQGQVAAAQAALTGDPRAVAAANAVAARRQLSAAVGPEEHAAAYANLLQAQQSGYDAQQQVIQMQGQLAQAQQAGNPVGQAAAAEVAARTELQYAHGLQARVAAETALANANYQYEQAQVQWQESLGQLAASQTVDPVEALRRQVSGTAAALSRAHTPQARVEVQTQLNNTTHQYEQQLIDQRESVIDFQFQMMQITANQAVSQLQDLLHLRGITLAQRQQLLEQIRRYQLGMEQPIGAQGFDLSPGNVRLPTYYDVAHAITSARPSGVSHAGSMHVEAPHNVTIQVNVNRHSDVPAVADAIDRAMSSQLSQRLRAAGVTS